MVTLLLHVSDMTSTIFQRQQSDRGELFLDDHETKIKIEC